MKRRYDLLYALGAVLASPYLAYRILRGGKWRSDWPGRVGRIPPLSPDPRPTVLLHGVSVGEINATRALVRRMGGEVPDGVRVVVSSTTDTGLARARELYGASRNVLRFPFDFSWMVRRFLDAVDPDLVALMELEVWPNLAEECLRRGIPLVVINGRLSDASFRQYRLVRFWVKRMFGGLTAVAAQTEQYAQRFRALGTPPERVRVTDNMKWDTVSLVDEVEGSEELRAELGIDPGKPLIVAGSTGPGEEELLIRSRPSGVQLLLVPRKPERFDEVAELVPGMVRRTDVLSSVGPSADEAKPELFLLDTMGELTKAYALADVVVIGRSLVPLGGSDPIEAIALGKPTIIGPHHDNFRDVVTAFREGGGIRVTENPMEVASQILTEPEKGRQMALKGREVIGARKGATERHSSLIEGLLKDRENRGPIRPHGRTSGRRRLLRWAWRGFLMYLVLGYLTTAFDWVTASTGTASTSPLPTRGESVVSGVFSVHTARSHDAWGTREQVAGAARNAGLDFVVVGDHPRDDRRPGWDFWRPEYREGVLVVGGQELRAPGAGKILAMSVDTTYKQWPGTYDTFREMLVKEGATSFVVHGRGPRRSERWIHPTVDGVQGWEVLDLSEFMRKNILGIWGPYHLLTFSAALPLGLGDEALLHLMRQGFSTPTVQAYDSLRGGTLLTATAGLNHHPKLRAGSLLFPPYEPFFRTLQCHVLVGEPLPADPAEARDFLARAAREGGVFIALGDDPSARDFRFGVAGPGDLELGPGTKASFSEGQSLRAGLLPRDGGGGSAGRFVFRIVRNGSEEEWILGETLDWPVKRPGVYRVEVYRYTLRIGKAFFRLRPWIFTNPLELSDSADAGGTAESSGNSKP